MPINNFVVNQLQKENKETMSITPAMEWRYATKKFDASRKLSSEDVYDLLEAGRLAPSSFGLQPYRLVIVENPAIRERVREAAANQPQVVEGSHLVVIAAETNVDEGTVTRYVDKAAIVRQVERASLVAREQFINRSIGRFSPEEHITWAHK